MAALLRDEHGCPIVLTDEHGCPVQLTDEFGNPKQLIGVATAGPPTLGSLLRADAALDSDPAVAAAVGGPEQQVDGEGVEEKSNNSTGHNHKQEHENNNKSVVAKIKQKLHMYSHST